MIKRICCAALACVSLTAAVGATPGTAPSPSCSPAADFAKVRKFDAHVHANTDDHHFLDIAAKDGFELLSINVDFIPISPPWRLRRKLPIRCRQPIRSGSII